MNSSDPRELTREEQAALRKLVASLCINYDYEYGCLPLDGPCFMFGKWWTGGYCKYFHTAVLPADPALEAALTGEAVPAVDTRTCVICRKPFSANGKQAYCSADCARKAHRCQQRKHMRDKRGRR